MRCPVCKKVFVLSRKICRDCFEKMEEMVEVSDQGTVLTYSVNYRPNKIQPYDAPLIYSVIQLDGADNGLVHLLGETDSEKLTSGMRVQAVFKDEREGNILDILYFKPLE